MTTKPLVPEYTEAQIASFLGAARETIVAVQLCWLATRSLEGGTNARAVDSFAGAPGSDEWTRRFLVRRNSRKVAEMRAAPSVTLAYQHPSGDRWVALGGRATIVGDNGGVGRADQLVHERRRLFAARQVLTHQRDGKLGDQELAEANLFAPVLAEDHARPPPRSGFHSHRHVGDAFAQFFRPVAMD